VLVVVGDSVPLGRRCGALPWPHRLVPLLPGPGDRRLSLHARAGVALADLDDTLADAVARAATADRLTVLVHAGHNDAQLRDGTPRVEKPAFGRAARDLDRTLAAAPAVDRHAFVGPVPLLRLDEPGSVPFDGAQPDRSLAYDELLADAVATHVPVARPVSAWRERTVDGVHPNAEGHRRIAERVAAALTEGE